MKPGECHGCGYETKRLKEYDDAWLCEVCANLPGAPEFLNESPGSAIRAIAKCTNMILAEIRKGGRRG